MSRELFRLVGVWCGCWVVRDAPPSHHSAHQPAEITRVTCTNTLLINHFNVILMNCNH
jgi:hypothetical protein